MQMYSSDYGGYLCWHCHRGKVDSTDTWACFTYSWYSLWTPYTDGTEVFHDPIHAPLRLGGPTGLHRYTQPPGGTGDHRDDYWSDYSWNQRAAFQNDLHLTGYGKRHSLGDVPYPTSTPMLSCHRGDWNGWTYGYSFRPGQQFGGANPYSTSLDGGPNYAYRHAGYHNRGINFLYVDGHVEWSAADKAGRDWYTGSLNRHWNLTRSDVQP